MARFRKNDCCCDSCAAPCCSGCQHAAPAGEQIQAPKDAAPAKEMPSGPAGVEKPKETSQFIPQHMPAPALEVAPRSATGTSIPIPF